MRVPFADLGLSGKAIEGEILAAVGQALGRGAFVGGPEVQAFEREFAAYCGARDAIAVRSGTDALAFALRAAGVGAGDEVITSPLSFFATAEAVSHVGATPVFVDVDPATALIDTARIADAVTRRTRAIVPVHLYGQPVRMEPVMALARARGVRVIEDACQAHGAEWRGRRAGSLGDLAAFSFYPSKNLGACGEGGAVTVGRGQSDDPDWAATIRLLRDHGQSQRYHHDLIGYNGRLDAIQCSILRIKLRHLDEANARRRKIALAYDHALAEVPGVRPIAQAESVLPVYHLYVVLVERRDAVRERLAAGGVETGLHYPVPIHLQAPYRALGYRAGDFPHAEWIAAHALSLPMFPEMTDEQVAYVVERLRRAL